MKVEETKVGGFNVKMFHLNEMTLGVATDIGPRILYLATRENPEFNLFGVLPEAGVQTSEGFWNLYGGHRLWSTPEATPRSYSLDNEPVKIESNEETITIQGNLEVENSTQKKITIEPLSEGGVKVVHTITNIGRWPLELGCWALSVMRQNGFAIIPLNAAKVDEEDLLPDRRVSFWPYSDLSDKRLRFINGYILVQQDLKAEKPVKVGAMANPTWTAYCIEGTVFVKEFSQEKGKYPDFGCNVEVYTNSDLLELETVGPLKIVNPSKSIQHTEKWRIHPVQDFLPFVLQSKDQLQALLDK